LNCENGTHHRMISITSYRACVRLDGMADGVAPWLYAGEFCITAPSEFGSVARTLPPYATTGPTTTRCTCCDCPRSQVRGNSGVHGDGLVSMLRFARRRSGRRRRISTDKSASQLRCSEPPSLRGVGERRQRRELR
jgi:hypothetical protein